MHSNKQFGKAAEDFAANWLSKKKFIILEQNYKKRFGEIDIIAKKDNLIIFIEVKARKINYFNLSELITTSKQRKIILTAKEYINVNNFNNKIFRFDVILIEQVNNVFEIKLIENAFNETMY